MKRERDTLMREQPLFITVDGERERKEGESTSELTINTTLPTKEKADYALK